MLRKWPPAIVTRMVRLDNAVVTWIVFVIWTAHGCTRYSVCVVATTHRPGSGKY
jgi:hypothetical protein